MKNPTLLPTETAGKVCLACGAAVVLIAAIFTVVTVSSLVTGGVAALESSRSSNLAYALLSAVGEVCALVGLGAGIIALLRKHQFSLGLAAGLLVNIIGLIVFLPATLALLFTGLFGLLDYVI